MSRDIRFAGYPSAFVFPEANKHSDWVNHLLWGEWVEVLKKNGVVEEEGDFVKVNVRGKNDGWMQKGDLQPNKLLEIYFVDIGQGDGCLVLTPLPTVAGEEPKNRAMLIDAGENDNMLRFINWKFNTGNAANPPFKFDDVIISHGDQDHYGGFQAIFENSRFEFENVYHNGLVERAVGNSLGTHQKIDGITYQTSVVSTPEELETIISNPVAVGKRKYPKLLKTAVGRNARVRMLSCGEDNLPVYLPNFEAGKDIEIEILGPFTKKKQVDGVTKTVLPRLKSNDGKTKNGHSIVFRLVYDKVKILLGGDLNVPAEDYLLNCHAGELAAGAQATEMSARMNRAKAKFGADVAKSCHHGSGDFSPTFLQAIDAAATVISSGDDEPHSHPRPNTLGALGKYGRGEFPLIFSTELARSAKEKIKKPSEVRAEIEKLLSSVGEADTPQEKEQLQKRKDELYLKLGRTIETFGMINVRTDGKKVIIAQKLEQKADRGLWDIHCLEPDSLNNGVLKYKAE